MYTYSPPASFLRPSTRGHLQVWPEFTSTPETPLVSTSRKRSGPLSIGSIATLGRTIETLRACLSHENNISWVPYLHGTGTCINKACRYVIANAGQL
jgi:hypothetical protein